MKYIADRQCPKCGEKMEHGILNGRGYPIHWIPLEADHVEERWKADLSESVRISGLAMTLNGAAEKYPTAYHCSACRKIVVDY